MKAYIALLAMTLSAALTATPAATAYNSCAAVHNYFQYDTITRLQYRYGPDTTNAAFFYLDNFRTASSSTDRTVFTANGHMRAPRQNFRNDYYASFTIYFDGDTFQTSAVQKIADSDRLDNAQTEVLLRSPLRAGMEWPSRDNDAVSYRIAQTGAVRLCKAGIFTNCIIVERRERTGLTESVSEIAYAPKIGMILWTVDNAIYCELESVEYVNGERFGHPRFYDETQHQ